MITWSMNSLMLNAIGGRASAAPPQAAEQAENRVFGAAMLICYLRSLQVGMGYTYLALAEFSGQIVSCLPLIT